jgi:hypothetical protein
MKCPVAVTAPLHNRKVAISKGTLCDISADGARFFSSGPFEVGSEIVIEVGFSSPRKGWSRIRFAGTVVRSETRREVAVRFSGSGRFLRDAIDGLRRGGPT